MLEYSLTSVHWNLAQYKLAKCIILKCLSRVYNIYLVIRHFFSILKQSKNLESSNKTDLDIWDCLGRVKLIL